MRKLAPSAGTRLLRAWARTSAGSRKAHKQAYMLHPMLHLHQLVTNERWLKTATSLAIRIHTCLRTDVCPSPEERKQASHVSDSCDDDAANATRRCSRLLLPFL